MKKIIAAVSAVILVGGMVVTLSAFSMQAEGDRRQQIYDEAASIVAQREADRLKAEKRYMLEAKKEKALVERARADAEKVKARADEAFSDYRDRHPVPDEFLKEETSDEESSEEEENPY